MTTSYVPSESEGFLVLTITGELNIDECANFRVATHNLFESTVVDLRELDYLDSSGLGCLLAFERELRIGCGRGVVLVINETVANILSLTRLNGVFHTASSVEEATQILKNLR